jgi:hypothetical protein
MLKSIYNKILSGEDKSKSHAMQAIWAGLPVCIDYLEEGVLARFTVENGVLVAYDKGDGDKEVRRIVGDNKYLRDALEQCRVVSKADYDKGAAYLDMKSKK